MWFARITAVALVMVLPGILGHWLDDQLGTQFFVLLGFALGLTGGMVQLLVMTGAWKPRGGSSAAGSRSKPPARPPSQSPPEEEEKGKSLTPDRPGAGGDVQEAGNSERSESAEP